MQAVYIAVCLALGYALGCFQSGYFTGRAIGHIDIREHGSGNAGATNVHRVLGRSAGLLVFVLDVCKAIIAFVLASVIFRGAMSFTLPFFTSNPTADFLPGILAVIGVVLGHNFPFYLRFKGGKGIASSLALFLCIDLRAALVVYAIGLLIVIVTKYVSLASLVMVALFPIALFILGYNGLTVALCAFIAVLAYVQHRANIKRLLSGTERKVKF